MDKYLHPHLFHCPPCIFFLSVCTATQITHAVQLQLHTQHLIPEDSGLLYTCRGLKADWENNAQAH
jgi:hypothetical protein